MRPKSSLWSFHRARPANLHFCVSRLNLWSLNSFLCVSMIPLKENAQSQGDRPSNPPNRSFLIDRGQKKRQAARSHRELWIIRGQDCAADNGKPQNTSPAALDLWRRGLGRIVSRLDASQLAAASKPSGAMLQLPFPFPFRISVGHSNTPDGLKWNHPLPIGENLCEKWAQNPYSCVSGPLLCEYGHI